MILECEQSQTHVGEDEIFCQEVEHLKQLQREQNTHGEWREEVKHKVIHKVKTRVTVQASVVFLSRKSSERDIYMTIFISLKPEHPRVSQNTNLRPRRRKRNANSRVGGAVLRKP